MTARLRADVPLKRVVVVPQNHMQYSPEEQRLHLNLEGEKAMYKKDQTLESKRRKVQKAIQKNIRNGYVLIPC